MQIQFNGTKEETTTGTTLKAFLLQKQINPSTVACELNMKIIRRAELENIHLNDGDVLEVIRMIGGG